MESKNYVIRSREKIPSLMDRQQPFILSHNHYSSSLNIYHMNNSTVIEQIYNAPYEDLTRIIIADRDNEGIEETKSQIEKILGLELKESKTGRRLKVVG